MTKLHLGILLGALVWGSVAQAAPTLTTEKRLYKPSPLNWGLDMGFSSAVYSQWAAAPGVVGIPGQNKGGHVGIEWISPFPYGKLGLGLGVSLGVLVNGPMGSGPNGDIFASLTAVPVQLMATYRMEYWENQILVPYGKLGGSSTFAWQTSKTGAALPGTYLGLGVDWAGGIELALHALDRSARYVFDSEFGFNGAYLFLEYGQSSALSGGALRNLSRREYRIGLRLEF